MRVRTLIIALLALAAVPSVSHAVVDIPDTLTSGATTHRAEALEGVWVFGDGESAIAVVRNRQGALDVVSLDTPMMGLRPGTLLGSAERMGSGDYRLHLATDLDREGRLAGRRTFRATVTDTDAGPRLEMSPEGLPVRARLWLLYRFFITVSVRDARRPDVLVARKVGRDGLMLPVVL